MPRFAERPLEVSSLEGFSWFQGAWVGVAESVTVEEHWSGLAGDCLMDMFRYLEGEQVRFFELMTLGMEDRQAVLRIKHINPGLRGWEEKGDSVEYVLVSLTDGEAIFVRRRGSERNWMVYRRTGDDLCITIESGISDTPEGGFRFVRVCETIS